MQTTVTVPGVDLKLLRRQMDALVRMEQSTTNQKEVDALEGIINFLEGALDAGDGVPAPTPKGSAKGDKCQHALDAFMSTIRATGGVTTDDKGNVVPVADEEWIDLGIAYELAREATAPQRLEELRKELRAETISLDELVELQSLAAYIPQDDVELREAAGMPEFTEGEDTGLV